MVRREATVPAICLLVCAIITGCAGSGGGGKSGTASDAYPDWVRTVPVATDEARYYVGGCLSAVDATGGVTRATADAVVQLTDDADDRFRELFDKAHLDARVQTTSTERFRFRTDGGEAYGARLRALAVEEDSYYRPCPQGDGTVCSIFVLLSIRQASATAALKETLAELRDAAREAGSTSLAAIGELMQRSLD